MKTFYDELVPEKHIVYIEFNPAESVSKSPESVDFHCWKKNDSENSNLIFQEWDVELNSKKLDSLLDITKWDRASLEKIKKALQIAHCVSIQNGEPTDIGYARSGMGKYSYAIFSDNLTVNQINENNNGCTRIFYKNNIVLQYGSGAIGSECFPDKE